MSTRLVAADPSGVNWSVLGQYGAVGLIAALGLTAATVLFRTLIASKDKQIESLNDRLKAEMERADRLERALAELNTTVRTQVMTALAEAQRAVSDAIVRFRRDR